MKILNGPMNVQNSGKLAGFSHQISSCTANAQCMLFIIEK